MEGKGKGQGKERAELKLFGITPLAMRVNTATSTAPSCYGKQGGSCCRDKSANQCSGWRGAHSHSTLLQKYRSQGMSLAALNHQG